MNKIPHKHAAIIKAWADGATIQFKNPAGEWVDCLTIPRWWKTTEYREKPEPHKWQEVMDAYAQGKVIQAAGNDKIWYDWQKEDPHCIVCGGPPWDSFSVQFRIKPELVERTAQVKLLCDPQVGNYIDMFHGDGANHNIKVIFENGVLVAAEVLKK